MYEVKFYDAAAIDDALLRFAVIVSRYKQRWVYCKHKARSTWEIPGGHREPGECILDAAKRELFEETGATQFEIKPVCVYAVKRTTEKAESFGMLYCAEIAELGPLPNSEIDKIEFFDAEPGNLTYPQIQPHLFARVRQLISTDFSA